MTKPLPQTPNPTSPSHLLTKLKRLPPSFTILLFLATLLFILNGGFKLNNGHFTRRKQSINGFDLLAVDKEEEMKGFLDFGSGSEEWCDLFDGRWVWDEGYPLYQERGCRFLDDGFRCGENGRPDTFYAKWRWQPTNCNLPRFDANMMLEKLRNRRVVFVGDSIGRNQWESLLCMLSSAVPNKDSVYEVNGSPITKHMGFLSFKFTDYNCTVEYYRAPFLVLQSRAPLGVAKEVKTTVKLDQMDWSSVQWRNADVLVFNTGHWWNYEKTIKGGSYFQDGAEVKMNMSIETAYQRSVKTLNEWIRREINKSKTQVIYRTYAPVHFRGGAWNTGGSCHLETLPELSSTLVPSGTWAQLRLVEEALSEHLNKSDLTAMVVLNVTKMTSQRKDGHASLYYLGPKTGPAPLHKQDCSHWCLPGVPDAWNELLYALFLKREVAHSKNLLTSQP